MEFKEKKRCLFLGLPLTFTTYTITEELVTIDQGFLSRKEDDCYMYKIQDVTLTTSLFENVSSDLGPSSVTPATLPIQNWS